MGYDPMPYWKRVKAPVFFAYGENDTNCPIQRSIQRIEENELENCKIEVYPNGEHAIFGVNSN